MTSRGSKMDFRRSRSMPLSGGRILLVCIFCSLIGSSLTTFLYLNSLSTDQIGVPSASTDFIERQSSARRAEINAGYEQVTVTDPSQLQELARIPEEDAHCMMHESHLMSCQYQTLCYDGHTYTILTDVENKGRRYAHMRKEWGLDLDTDDFEMISQNMQFDWKLTDEVYNDAGMRRHKRPFFVRGDYKIAHRETFLAQAEVIMLPDHTHFTPVPMSQSYPHLWFMSSSIIGVWNSIYKRAMGNKWYYPARAVYVDYYQSCVIPWVAGLLAGITGVSDTSDGRTYNTPKRMQKYLDEKVGMPPNEQFPLKRLEDWTVPGKVFQKPVNVLTRDTFFTDTNRTTKKQCDIQNKIGEKHDRIVCSNKAVLHGRSLRLVNDGNDRRILRNKLLVMMGEKISDDDSAILDNVVKVVLIDRARNRGLQNIDEIIKMLEGLQHPGNITVDLDYYDDMPVHFENQLKLFANAHIVIMVHGAGLVNTMFMQRNSALIEVLPWGIGPRIYGEMYSSGGGYYRSIVGMQDFNNTVVMRNDCYRKSAGYLTSAYKFHHKCYNSLFKRQQVLLDVEKLKEVVLDSMHKLLYDY